MNPVYTIMESPYRWAILAGLTALAGTGGAIAMLAYVWPHAVATVWLIAWFLLAAFFLIRAMRDYGNQIEVIDDEVQGPGDL